MATSTEPRRAADKSLPTLATELWHIVLDYLKQEAVDPAKGLLRFVGYGIGGSLLLSLGLLLWVLGLLRILQTETGSHLGGHLSWLPYLITIVACAVVTGLAVRAIFSHRRKVSGKGGTA